jgi:signal transduction histidine kinase
MVKLEESRLARHLTGAALKLLIQGAQSRTYPEGSRIFEEGSAGDGLYVINEGQVEIAARSVPGRMHRLAVMEPGDYFGEMAVFDGGARSASAFALQPVTAHFVATPIIQSLLEQSPLLAADLVRDSSLRMRDFNRRFLQELLKAERLSLVERLARTIVHDFRNSLNVIGIAADIAAEPSATLESRRSARDRVRRQVEVLDRMMQELLDFTRGMTASTVLPRINYARFLHEALVELHPAAQLRGITVVHPPDIEHPEVNVRLDTLRLQRVFNNLFQNAFDALADQPQPRLEIRMSYNDEEVMTEIVDSGPGIPPEVLPHVFQPFVTFGKAHGSGLGLAICDRIIAEHGGRMTAGNVPGGGAYIQFRLPRTKPGDTEILPTPLPGS